MSTEEKIDAIHDAVIQIKSDMSANKIVCATVHKAVDDRLTGLHRTIKGNGQPGLEQKHEDLKTRFDKLETRLVVWACVAIFIGQIIAPKLLAAMGWK